MCHTPMFSIGVTFALTRFLLSNSFCVTLFSRRSLWENVYPRDYGLKSVLLCTLIPAALTSDSPSIIIRSMLQFKKYTIKVLKSAFFVFLIFFFGLTLSFLLIAFNISRPAAIIIFVILSLFLTKIFSFFSKPKVTSRPRLLFNFLSFLIVFYLQFLLIQTSFGLNIPTPPPAIPEWFCSREARQVIQEKSLKTIYGCETKTIKLNGKNARIVEVTYGSRPDWVCATGCLYTAVVQDGKIHEIPQEPDLSSILSKRYSEWCILDQSKERKSLRRELMERAGKYYWFFSFNNLSNEEDLRIFLKENELSAMKENPQVCIFNGTLAVIKGELDENLSKLQVQFKPLEGFTPISADKAIEKCLNDKESLADVKANCITWVAVAKQDPKLCFRVPEASTRALQEGCMRMVAFYNKDISICEMIKRDERQKKRCYEDFRTQSSP